MIDFNGMSNRLGLFYALRLGNHVHCTFMFTFFVVISFKFFGGDVGCTQSYQI